jgi:hypothetical protein
MTEQPRGPIGWARQQQTERATCRPIRWVPDDDSAQILAAYRRTREPLRSVLRRALRHLAIADGILDSRGQIRQQGRRP